MHLSSILPQIPALATTEGESHCSEGGCCDSDMRVKVRCEEHHREQQARRIRPPGVERNLPILIGHRAAHIIRKADL